jgi:hypothetical protein
VLEGIKTEIGEVCGLWMAVNAKDTAFLMDIVKQR